MQYKFYELEWFWGGDYPIPSFEVLDKKYEDLGGLSRMGGEYIRKIVDNLTRIKKGEKFDYNFGTESTIVKIFSKDTKYTKYAGRTYFRKTFTKDLIEIPFDDIYNLMKDYLSVIEEWEERTGMEKPGAR